MSKQTKKAAADEGGGLDFKRLKKAELKQREALVKVPTLALVLGCSKADAVLRVRGLSGFDIAKINEKVEALRIAREKKIAGAIQEHGAFAGALDAIEALKQEAASGWPDEMFRRLLYFEAGCVDMGKNGLDHEAVLKIRDAFHVAFMEVSTQIILLSGAGYEEDKKKFSGKTTKSKQPSPSDGDSENPSTN